MGGSIERRDGFFVIGNLALIPESDFQNPVNGADFEIFIGNIVIDTDSQIYTLTIYVESIEHRVGI